MLACGVLLAACGGGAGGTATGGTPNSAEPADPGNASLRLEYLCRSLMLACGVLLAACGGGAGGTATGGTPNSAEPADPGNASLRLELPASGLGPADLAVVVAEGDAQSEAVAAAYLAAHGVPAGNLVRVRVNTALEAISAADFALLKADLDAKLPPTAQATVLTWARPTRVEGPSCTMSITAATALGYDPRYCSASVCATTAASPYFDSESRQPWADHRLRPSMLLGPRTLADAHALIQRGVASIATLPGGDVWAVRTTEAARNTRADDLAALPGLWGSALRINYLDNAAGPASANSLRDKRDVLAYFTGLAKVDHLATLAWRPGAPGDALTSVAGYLPTPPGGQTSVLEWLASGATGSYGTVQEPCNFTQKFPKASVLLDHYWRGARLIEAYWKSVEWPGEGLFVGDPLAQPFQDAPSLSVVNGQYQVRTRNLRPGARYSLQYRLAGSSTWSTLAQFTGTRGQVLQATASLAPSAAVQLRWTGPCAADSAASCALATSP
ncbi:TIGR03790 family protein [Roseateles paludis]|uniref:TIGR03790 family protein n=1 Tax=Roseateles paludis TaxID=3145238 RepID=A0ABV0FZT2_9BURK